MPIELVVFDMAGTTIEDDNHVAAALQSAMKAAGYSITLGEANEVMGYPKPVAIRWLLEQKAGKAVVVDDTIVDHIHNTFVEKMIGFYQDSNTLSQKDGVLDTFRKLKEQGVKVALDTGFTRDIANTIFDKLGWKESEHFDISITSDEVANGRPYPDMIYRAMELLHIPETSKVAKVGDTASDMQQGSAAGCKYVIGITTGAYTAEQLSREQHTHLIRRIPEVLDIVCNNTHS